MSDTCLGCGKKLYKKDHYYADGYCESCHVSEKKGPFDGAIKAIEKQIEWIEQDYSFPRHPDDRKNEIISLRVAIRVIEAARKVDKQKTRRCLMGLLLGTMKSSECQDVFGILDALLECLPEKEER